MATAPTVRDLNTLVTELNPSIQSQRDLITQQIAANETSGQAQIAGLGAKKDQAFGQITAESQDRGALFSGFSPSKQAEYLGTSYMPALAALEQQIAATRGNLQMQNAGLDTDIFNKAFQTREGDIAAGRDWNVMEAGQEFSTNERVATQNFTTQERAATEAFTTKRDEYQNSFASKEAEIQRAFDAGQNERANQLQIQLQQEKIAADREMTQLQIAADAAQQAANRRAATAAPKAPTAAEAKSTMLQQFGADAKGLLSSQQAQAIPYYTEQVIIPKLAATYPEMNIEELKAKVYAIRGH